MGRLWVVRTLVLVIATIGALVWCACSADEPRELPLAATYETRTTLQGNGCQLPDWTEGEDFFPTLVVSEEESGVVFDYQDEFAAFLDALIGSSRFEGVIDANRGLDLTGVASATVVIDGCSYTSQAGAHFHFDSTTFPGECDREVVARLLAGDITITLAPSGSCDDLVGCESVIRSGGSGNDPYMPCDAGLR